jgi:23S rRNA pseudouridine1911/1915/1917 synthase
VTVLDRLRDLYPEASGRALGQWLAHGRVQLNGRPVRDGRADVAESDRVWLAPRGQREPPPQRLPASEPGRPKPALSGGLALIHEDDDLLVIDKPPGLLTIATERERERTAYRLVWDYLAGRRPPGRPFIVHRLDRETSGLVVVAKSPAVKAHLQAQFEARAVERGYVAVVEGRVRLDGGTLESQLVQDRALRVRSGRGGKRAITRFRVLARRRDTTALGLELGTGRRHQIRVQLAEMGHPIVGDREHGSQRPSKRLLLHACRLGFVHPATGHVVTFESAPPTGWV